MAAIEFIMEFLDLGVSSSLVKAMAVEGIANPYPIQVQAIPAILAKKDVLGIAKTGSGKTASYVLPILMMDRKKPLKNRHVRVLILVPTRELAVQVQTVFKQFSLYEQKPMKTMAVYGGVSINPQMMALQSIEVLIATPGRLLELMENNSVHLNEIETLVLDEADKMLNLGFKEEVDKILGVLPAMKQSLLFSATLNEDVASIHQLLLNNPVVLKIEEPTENLDLINQSSYFVSEEKKGPLLRFLLKNKDWKQVLIFTSSVYQVDNVTDKLLKHGFDAMSIHSKKSQGARTEAMAKFKSGKLRILVATDLLSRGIDIQFLPCVINYELPRSPKDYVHRIGRTGRAENPGEAIAFVTMEDQHHFKIIQKKMGKRVEMLDADELV